MLNACDENYWRELGPFGTLLPDRRMPSCYLRSFLLLNALEFRG